MVAYIVGNYSSRVEQTRMVVPQTGLKICTCMWVGHKHGEEKLKV